MPRTKISAEAEGTVDPKNIEDFEKTMPKPVSEDSSYDADYWEERVDWFVPLDPTQPHDRTLLVQINGHFFKMMRGTTVKVPRYVIQDYNERQAQMVELLLKQEEYENMKNLTDM